MNKSTREALQETLASLREIVHGMNLLDELKTERHCEKDREHKLKLRSKKHLPHERPG